MLRSVPIFGGLGQHDSEGTHGLSGLAALAGAVPQDAEERRRTPREPFHDGHAWYMYWDFPLNGPAYPAELAGPEVWPIGGTANEQVCVHAAIAESCCFPFHTPRTPTHPHTHTHPRAHQHPHRKPLILAGGVVGRAVGVLGLLTSVVSWPRQAHTLAATSRASGYLEEGGPESLQRWPTMGNYSMTYGDSFWVTLNTWPPADWNSTALRGWLQVHGGPSCLLHSYSRALLFLLRGH